MISNNVMGSGTLGSMLDPGSCMCHENYEADAINQTARDFPDTVAS
jgi:quinolinate synthase